jgi:hypothetical protein
MKIAAKLLSQSDLTLFEAFYRLNGTSKQKGVNLNGDVLADRFYPGLPKSLASADEVPITLDIFGPRGAGLQRLRRKIVKPVGGKNWRLNGKLIEEPLDQVGRYSNLTAGDVALFAFMGEPVPSGLIMIILSQADPIQRTLRDTIVNDLGLTPRSRSMVQIDEADLARFAADAPPGDPISLLLPDPSRDQDLELTVLGDAGAADRLQHKTASTRSRSVTADELASARQRASDIGRAGEVIVNEMLAAEREAGAIADYTWDADMDALAPYDFTIITTDGLAERIDVKSTTGPFEGYFHISDAELRKASLGDAVYRIYRVYGLDTDSGPKLKRSSGIVGVATDVLASLSGLPAGVRVASVQLSSNLLEWGCEESLRTLEEES